MKNVFLVSFASLCMLLLMGLSGITDYQPQRPLPLARVNTEMMRQLFKQYKASREKRLAEGSGAPRMTSAEIRLSDKALISINHPWTNTPIINAAETVNEIERRVFSDNAVPDFDALYFNSADVDRAVAFFLDPLWNRVVFTNKSENWLKSYGEWHGPPRNELYMAGPRSMTVDISPNNAVYVADTDNGRILKLTYGVGYLGGEGSFSFTVPGIGHPIDICLPCGANGYADGIWIADNWSGRLVEITRGQQVLTTIDRYTISNLTYMLTAPRSVAAETFPWPRLGFIDAVRNAFVVCDPTSVSGTTATGLSSTEFAQQGSRLERIGVDMTKNWWVADVGLGKIHLFDFDGNYLASLDPPSAVGMISTSPCYWDGSYLNQPFYIFTAEPWSNTNGLRAYLPGADVVDMQVEETPTHFRLSSVLTNLCQVNVRVVRASDGGLVQTIHTGGSLATIRVDEVAKSSLAYGTYKYRVEVKPIYNSDYGADSVQWLVREVPFSFPVMSTSLTATATNNQRKTGESASGVLCMVYENENGIFFTTSTDAMNWSSPYCVNEGIDGSINHKFPSMVVRNEIAEIVWQRQQGTGEFSTCEIFLRRYHISSDTWDPAGQVGAVSQLPEEDFHATPVIDAVVLTESGEHPESKLIAWRNIDGISVVNYSGELGWSEVIWRLEGTDAECKYPSVAAGFYHNNEFGLCWQNDLTQSVEFMRLNRTGEGWKFFPIEQVSPMGWGTNQRPSIAITNTWNGYGEELTVAWQSVDNVVEGISVHTRQSAYGGGLWGSITSYSAPTGGAHPHPSVGTYALNQNASLVWDFFGDVYAATYNGSAWSSPTLLATGASGGTDCNINAQSSARLIALWHKPNGQIANVVIPGEEYQVEEDGPLALLDSSNVQYRLNRHGIVSLKRALGNDRGTVSGMMAFEIAGMKLVTPEGEETLEFSDESSTHNKNNLLSSKPFTVTSGNTALRFAGAAYGKRLAIPMDSVRTIAEPIARVLLRQRESRTVRREIWSLPFSDLESMRDSVYGIFRTFAIDLGNLMGQEVYVDVEMLGHGRVAPLIDDDYLIRSSGSELPLGGNPVAKMGEKTIPASYNLYQNYPNPFNPSTKIQFDLPEAQVVSLKVFNVLGQEVVTLAYGHWEAGNHSVSVDFSNLPSGMYLYRLTAGSFNDVKKLLVIK